MPRHCVPAIGVDNLNGDGRASPAPQQRCHLLVVTNACNRNPVERHDNVTRTARPLAVTAAALADLQHTPCPSVKVQSLVEELVVRLLQFDARVDCTVGDRRKLHWAQLHPTPASYKASERRIIRFLLRACHSGSRLLAPAARRNSALSCIQPRTRRRWLLFGQASIQRGGNPGADHWVGHDRAPAWHGKARSVKFHSSGHGDAGVICAPFRGRREANLRRDGAELGCTGRHPAVVDLLVVGARSEQLAAPEDELAERGQQQDDARAGGEQDGDIDPAVVGGQVGVLRVPQRAEDGQAEEGEARDKCDTAPGKAGGRGGGLQQESALARRSRLPRSFALVGQRRAAGDPDCHCCMRRGEREVEGRRGESAGERDSGYTGERPGVIALEVHEGHRRYGHSALPFQTRTHSQFGSSYSRLFVSIV